MKFYVHRIRILSLCRRVPINQSYSPGKVYGNSSSHCKTATSLRELTCHMGSRSDTCHPTEVTFPPSPQPKLVLDLATPQGCKVELTYALQ